MSTQIVRFGIAVIPLAPVLTACGGSKGKKRAPEQDDIPGQYQKPDEPG